MHKLALAFVSAAFLSCAGSASAQAVVGKAAPEFAGTDLAGKTVSLSDFKGKFVVLEWTNPECPFVDKHYGSGNMPAVQKELTGKGVVWVSIQTIPDRDGQQARSELRSWQSSTGAAPTTTLIDPEGRIARTYQARTTPHMYVVNPQGTLIYAGAIDSKPSSNPADIKTATNYVTQALGEAMSGKQVSQAVTRAYGCSVKYPA